MNRALLLKKARASGFTGKADLPSLVAFLGEQGLNTEAVETSRDANGEPVLTPIKDIWTKTVHLMCDAGEQVQQHEPPGGEGGGEAESQPPAPPQKSVKSAAREDDEGEARPTRQNYRPGIGWRDGIGRVEGKGAPEKYAATMARKSYDRRAKAGLTALGSSDEAELFAATVRLKMSTLDPRATDYSHKRFDEEIVGKALTTGGIGTGEALNIGQFIPTIIENVEKYGAARVVCPTIPMSEHTAIVPRLTGDFAAAGMSEGTATTPQSTPTTNQVTLVAKKIGGIVQVSPELMHDSAISVSDLLMRSMARGMAKREDQDFFIGDGTSTYDGFLGCGPALSALSGTIANIAGLVVAAGNLFEEFTLTDSRKVVGKIPEYADNPGSTFWVCNRTVAHGTLFRLEDAAGGNTRSDIQSGSRPMHLGYPVVYSQVMPKADANSQIAALFGDFSMGAKFGMVTDGMQMQMSDQRYFTEDLLAFKITERIAINVHDVGNASATAASREPGPIVGLISAAS